MHSCFIIFTDNGRHLSKTNYYFPAYCFWWENKSCTLISNQWPIELTYYLMIDQRRTLPELVEQYRTEQDYFRLNPKKKFVPFQFLGLHKHQIKYDTIHQISYMKKIYFVIIQLIILRNNDPLSGSKSVRLNFNLTKGFCSDHSKVFEIEFKPLYLDIESLLGVSKEKAVSGNFPFCSKARRRVTACFELLAKTICKSNM